MQIVPSGQGKLTASIEAPDPMGWHIPATLYVDYSNTGNAPMPAPLLVLTAATTDGYQGAWLTLDRHIASGRRTWTSATPAGYSNRWRFWPAAPRQACFSRASRCACRSIMPAGKPGSGLLSGMTFTLGAIQTNDTTPVDWSSMQASLQPAGDPASPGTPCIPILSAQSAPPPGGYVQMLDSEAAYLGRLGEDVTDLSSLWGFAVAQIRTSGRCPRWAAPDDSLPTPGSLSLSFDRIFDQSIPGRFQTGPLGLGWSTSWQESLSVAADGTVTITDGGGGTIDTSLTAAIRARISRKPAILATSPPPSADMTSCGRRYPHLLQHQRNAGLPPGHQRQPDHGRLHQPQVDQPDGLFGPVVDPRLQRRRPGQLRHRSLRPSDDIPLRCGQPAPDVGNSYDSRDHLHLRHDQQ